MVTATMALASVARVTLGLIVLCLRVQMIVCLVVSVSTTPVCVLLDGPTLTALSKFAPMTAMALMEIAITEPVFAVPTSMALTVPFPFASTTAPTTDCASMDHAGASLDMVDWIVVSRPVLTTVEMLVGATTEPVFATQSMLEPIARSTKRMCMSQ